MALPRPGGQQAPSADLAEQVFREQLRLAFELLPVAIIANLVLTLAVCAALAGVVPALDLGLWAACMLVLIGVRAAAIGHYRRTPPDERNYRRYAFWYFFPYVLTGLGWAILASFLVPADRELYAVLAMCAVCGLAAGGVAFLGHMRDLYGAYLLVTLMPAAARWLAAWWQFGGEFRLIMGVTTLVFIGLLYSAAHQLSRLVGGAVAERLEKEALARRLQELVATVERANQAKGDFIARMSRQVYAPTRAIVGQARELLDTGAGGVPEAAPRQTLQGLHDGAQSLLDMLGDVMDYSSLEAGQLQIERAPFDLRELIARAAYAAQVHAGDKGLAFTCTVGDEVPAMVAGDARRLAQILANLLSNAVKFCSAGEVSLEVRQVSVEGERHTLAFAVRDTGVGIAAQRLGEVFQPFAHGADTLPGSGLAGSTVPGSGLAGSTLPGSGLGLAICRRLAGLMQGAIAVESAPGRGSVFTLMLALNRSQAL